MPRRNGRLRAMSKSAMVISRNSVVARFVAAAEHDANVARMVRLVGGVADCGNVRFGGPVPHGAGRIHVFMHDSRLGPRVTIQLSQNGTTRSASAASRCRKTVQLGVTWVTYRQAALLTASGTPLCGRSYQRGVGCTSIRVRACRWRPSSHALFAAQLVWLPSRQARHVTRGSSERDPNDIS